MYQLAEEQSDYATQAFLNWFVEEQVEEEDSAREIVDTLEAAGGRNHVLLSLDKEMGQRSSDNEE